MRVWPVLSLQYVCQSFFALQYGNSHCRRSFDFLKYPRLSLSPIGVGHSALPRAPSLPPYLHLSQWGVQPRVAGRGASPNLSSDNISLEIGPPLTLSLPLCFLSPREGRVLPAHARARVGRPKGLVSGFLDVSPAVLTD